MDTVNNQIQVAYSFDTTGSMYPCLAQVRRNLRANIERLGREVPGILIAVIAHGDYCDARSSYTLKSMDFTSDVDAVCRFVDSVGSTGGGGNGGEAYELVMRTAQGLSWRPGYNKALVMTGDEPPHTADYWENTQRLDWRVEAKKLASMEIPIYAVQALNRRESTAYWRQFAELTGGFHIPLDQFSYITDLFLAVCYSRGGIEQVEAYEAEVTAQKRMDRGLTRIFDVLMGRVGDAARANSAFGNADDLKAVPPGRFQVLQVDTSAAIKDFVIQNGATFKTGRGFYEFTKREEIQEYKEVILQDRASGDMFTGERARELMGVGAGTINLSPKEAATVNQKYRIFVQSTSNNRKLIGGTLFLYEVEDWNAYAYA